MIFHKGSWKIMPLSCTNEMASKEQYIMNLENANQKVNFLSKVHE